MIYPANANTLDPDGEGGQSNFNPSDATGEVMEVQSVTFLRSFVNTSNCFEADVLLRLDELKVELDRLYNSITKLCVQKDALRG